LEQLASYLAEYFPCISTSQLQQLIFAVVYQMPAISLGLLLNRVMASVSIRVFLFLPGTLVHEGLHWIAAFLLNGQPQSFSVWPKRKEDGHWTLGTVTVLNITWYNGIFIGLAPCLSFLILLMLAPSYSDWQLTERDWWYWLCTAPILILCLPSWQDLKVALRSLLPIIYLLFAAVLTYFAFIYLVSQIHFS